MAVVFALLALVGWGTGDIFVTKASRKFGDKNTYFWWLIFSGVIASLYIPFAGYPSDFFMFFIALIMCFFGAVGSLLYFKALQIGHSSLIGTISGAFASITVPLSIIFFGETITLFQGLYILLIIAGIIIASLNFSEFRTRSLKKMLSAPGVDIAFLVMVIWGIYWAFIRIPVESIGWFWAGYPGYLFFLVMIVLGMIKRNVFSVVQKKSTVFLFLIMSVFTTVAGFSYNLGITYGYTSIVAPIAGASPVLFVILTRFVFREPLRRSQTVGILLSLTGILLLSFSG